MRFDWGTKRMLCFICERGYILEGDKEELAKANGRKKSSSR